jgi:hypothetical protein
MHLEVAQAPITVKLEDLVETAAAEEVTALIPMGEQE